MKSQFAAVVGLLLIKFHVRLPTTGLPCFCLTTPSLAQGSGSQAFTAVRATVTAGNGMCSSGGSGGMKRIRSACVKTSSSKTCFVSLSRDLVEAIGLRVQVCLLAVFLVYTVCGPWSATKN